MCDTEIIGKHRYQSIVINYPTWDYTISIHFFSYLVVYLVYNHLKIFTRYIASSGIKIDFFFFNIEHSRKFFIAPGLPSLKWLNWAISVRGEIASCHVTRISV